MKLKNDIEKYAIIENKREQLIDAEFGIMTTTGRISGNVKNILYLEKLNERKENIDKLKDNIGDLFIEILRLSDALKLDIDEIIKDKIVS